MKEFEAFKKAVDKMPKGIKKNSIQVYLSKINYLLNGQEKRERPVNPDHVFIKGQDNFKPHTKEVKAAEVTKPKATRRRRKKSDSQTF